MAVFGKTLNSWPSAARLATFITFFTACMVSSHAQSGNTPSPGSRFQYSALTGSGNTITATRVPVVTSKGQTVYQDITLQFDADPDGNVTLTSGYPIFSQSTTLPAFSFQAGKYVGSRSNGNGKAFVTVGGPGVTGGGTSWSMVATSDADLCSYPGSATWYVGPIENSPQAGRLKLAGSTVGSSTTRVVGITSTAWSYGVSGGSPSRNCDPNLVAVSATATNPAGSFENWQNGSLIGVSQSGNTITIASFTKFAANVGSGNQTDYSSPVDQITFVLVP
jgi:hypothetical protein